MPERFNVYWITPGKREGEAKGIALDAVTEIVEIMLSAGGEITGIIDAEKE